MLLLSIGISATFVQGKSFSKTIEADLDSNGTTERIELNSGREATLQIWQGETLLWQGVPANWKPWKLEIADVDGDGKKEIAVGVFKSTKFFPKPHNCLFIYGFDKDEAFPKWLGSSLSRPFTDYFFADLDGKSGDELIAFETTLDGKKALAGYFWDSFGFTRSWQQGVWDSLQFLNANEGKITVNADGQEIIFIDSELRGK